MKMEPNYGSPPTLFNMILKYFPDIKPKDLDFSFKSRKKIKKSRKKMKKSRQRKSRKKSRK